MTMVEAARAVTGGVDTHLDVHVAAALDPVGGLLGTEEFTADPAGYKAMLSWLEGFGEVAKVGMEGTGSYGAGLARFLRHQGIEVVEVDRQSRQAACPARQVRPHRRRGGGPGHLGGAGWPAQIDGRRRRSHPRARRRQALRPAGQVKSPHPDAPSGLHSP